MTKNIKVKCSLADICDNNQCKHKPEHIKTNACELSCMKYPKTRIGCPVLRNK